MEIIVSPRAKKDLEFWKKIVILALNGAASWKEYRKNRNQIYLKYLDVSC